MSEAGIRGGDFLMRVAARAGVLDVVVKHRLGPVTFGVPIGHLRWDHRHLENYEAQTIECLCKTIADYKDVTLFDCGADVGVFAALMCSKSDRLASVIAFEPNANRTEVLSWNMSQLPVRSQVIAKAVGSFNGRGRLENPAYDPASDVARFLVPGDGPIEVTTVDGCGVRGGDVAIKIDVEGGELEVLHGAKETIGAARACAVSLEAHPLVAARTGCDPVECLRFLKSIRPFSFFVAETSARIATSEPLLRDGQTEVWNIIGESI
jgi:FkbM family methyltransferase